MLITTITVDADHGQASDAVERITGLPDRRGW